MRNTISYALFATTTFAAIACLTAAPTMPTFAAAPGNAAEPTPVEPDMHEFMEYVFQPSFKALKPAMASEPADKKGWFAIKSNSLILAEGGNLLLIREAQTDAEDWAKHSYEVRDYGGNLYRAAQAKDYTAAKKSYQSMVKSCNACHEQFAGGEHILSP